MKKDKDNVYPMYDERTGKFYETELEEHEDNLKNVDEMLHERGAYEVPLRGMDEFDDETSKLFKLRQFLQTQIDEINKPTKVIKGEIVVKTRKIPTNTDAVQMDVYRDFIVNDSDGDMSNIHYLWDRIPKYVLSLKTQSSLKKQNGKLENLNLIQKRGNDLYEITIAPASISIPIGKKIVDGLEVKQYKTEQFYPSQDEEILESILRKLFIDQNLGIYHKTQREQSCWVKFQLVHLRKEFAKLGRIRNDNQIKKSLQILVGSTLTIQKNGDNIHSGSIIKEWIDKPSQNSGTENKWSAIQFPHLFMLSIFDKTYNQFDWLRTYQIKSPIARWLALTMYIEYTWADPFARPFVISQKRIEDESCMFLNIKSPIQKRKMVRDAIFELEDANLISLFDDPINTENRDIVKIEEYKHKKQDLNENIEKLNLLKKAKKNSDEFEDIKTKLAKARKELRQLKSPSLGNLLNAKLEPVIEETNEPGSKKILGIDYCLISTQRLQRLTKKSNLRVNKSTLTKPDK